jgi:hypothetical protein
LAVVPARGRAVLCVLLVLGVLVSACGSANPFRQYEYEEDLYLSLDGSATIYVNASLVALDALRGAAFDTDSKARFDRDAVRDFYAGPVTHVTWARSSRRSGRRFAHLRIEVDDINRLSTVAPFSWSTYQFSRQGDVFVFKQAVGAAAKDAGQVALAGLSGREPVAFRLHLPSKITFHDNGSELRRGNILVWEQSFADRLKGVPLSLEARMETQSILYRALWLFGATLAAVAVLFVILIWWIVKRGGKGGIY